MNFRYYFDRNINIILNFFCRKEQVAVLHTGRCGSNVLGFMLKIHSKIFWANEIFDDIWYENIKTHTKNKKKFVSSIINRSRNSTVSKIYGFETKYLPEQHLSDRAINMNLDDYIALLHKLNISKFIVIYRKNYLRQAISEAIAIQTDKWTNKENVTSLTKVRLEVNSTNTDQASILERFNSQDEHFYHLNKLLSNDKTLHLVYEDDTLEDPRIAYRKACDFLNVDDESPNIVLKKQNPFSYEDMLVNFDEVKATLKDTKYSWMLDA